MDGRYDHHRPGAVGRKRLFLFNLRSRTSLPALALLNYQLSSRFRFASHRIPLDPIHTVQEPFFLSLYVASYWSLSLSLNALLANGYGACVRFVSLSCLLLSSLLVAKLLSWDLLLHWYLYTVIASAASHGMNNKFLFFLHPIRSITSVSWAEVIGSIFLLVCFHRNVA